MLFSYSEWTNRINARIRSIVESYWMYIYWELLNAWTDKRSDFVFFVNSLISKQEKDYITLYCSTYFLKTILIIRKWKYLIRKYGYLIGHFLGIGDFYGTYSLSWIKHFTYFFVIGFVRNSKIISFGNFRILKTVLI